MSTHYRLILAFLLIGMTVPIGIAPADTQQLERLNVGDMRLYYTTHSPGALHHRGKPLIESLYFYTAVKAETGKHIEGFNFYRNEDGRLKFDKEQIEGGYRLRWTNQRHIYSSLTRRTDRLAGQATMTLTMTGDECALRYQGKIEPNPGYGEQQEHGRDEADVNLDSPLALRLSPWTQPLRPRRPDTPVGPIGGDSWRPGTRCCCSRSPGCSCCGWRSGSCLACCSTSHPATTHVRLTPGARQSAPRQRWRV